MKRPQIFDDFFDLVLCINMDKHTDRWKYMSEQFEKYDVPAIRVQGFPGRDIPENLYYHDAPLVVPMHGPPLGSLISHANAIHTAKILGAKSVLIFEDDVTLKRGFMDKVCNEFLVDVPLDWDMMYLGGKIILDKAHVEGVAVRPSYMYWTIAYAVRDTAYDKCLEALYTKNHWADQLLAGLHPQLKMYCPDTPRPVQQNLRGFESENKSMWGKKKGEA